MSAPATLDAWRASAATSPPTANMMRWMSAYETPCAYFCCRSIDCAQVRCTFCMASLTAHGSPSARFECMQCPIAEVEDMDKNKAYVSCTTMCTACFGDGTAARHQHADAFCAVDSRGRHQMCARPVPASPLAELTVADFTSVPAHVMCALSQDDAAACALCTEPFSSDERPAVAPAFCSHAHRPGFVDNNHGFKQADGYWCAECSLEWEKSLGRDQYCDTRVFCGMCRLEAERAAFRAEFQRERADAETEAALEVEQTRTQTLDDDTHAANVRREVSRARCERARALRELHRQAWVRAILVDVFSEPSD
jgi:hypothetical protein